MEPDAQQEARAWLQRAGRDLLVVERALAAAPVLCDAAAYHAHQAAEKALKAVLALHDQPVPRTHDLVALLTLSQRWEPRLARHLGAAQTLTPYVIAFRYPGGPLEPELGEAREAQRLAAGLVSAVAALVG